MKGEELSRVLRLATDFKFKSKNSKVKHSTRYPEESRMF